MGRAPYPVMALTKRFSVYLVLSPLLYRPQCDFFAQSFSGVPRISRDLLLPCSMLYMWSPSIVISPAPDHCLHLTCYTVAFSY